MTISLFHTFLHDFEKEFNNTPMAIIVDRSLYDQIAYKMFQKEKHIEKNDFLYMTIDGLRVYREDILRQQLITEFIQEYEDWFVKGKHP